jgi:hypothetical protein
VNFFKPLKPEKNNCAKFLVTSFGKKKFKGRERQRIMPGESDQRGLGFIRVVGFGMRDLGLIPASTVIFVSLNIPEPFI